MKVMNLCLVILGLMIIQVQSPDYFCSVYCQQQECQGINDNQCKKCASPFTNTSSLSGGGGPCTLSATSTWFLVSDTGIPVSAMNQSCGRYTYAGNLTSSSNYTITIPAIPDNHFRIQVFYWTIHIDDWGSSEQTYLTYNGSTKSMGFQSGNYKQKQCGDDGKEQQYNQGSISIDHSDTSASLTFTISSNSNKKYGIKQFIVLAQKCDAACQLCFGSGTNRCTACVYPYILTGYNCSNMTNASDPTTCQMTATTCNNGSCLTGYGVANDTSYCILCNQTSCLTCQYDANNCFTCKNVGSGGYYLFPEPVGGTSGPCVRSCPLGFYLNSTDRTCYPCASPCQTCRFNSTYCLTCVLPQSVLNGECYGTCPSNSFAFTTTNNVTVINTTVVFNTSSVIVNTTTDTNLGNKTSCISCNARCLTCYGSLVSQCYNCTVNGTYEAYLLNNTCYITCPTGYYNQNYLYNGSNVCIACYSLCISCSINSTYCSQCNSTFYLYANTCASTCPTIPYPDNLFPDNNTWTCALCSVSCTKLTMTMAFTSSVKSTIIVDMAFSQDMDFSTFDYANFQTYSFDDPILTNDMFNFDLSIINNSTYRITIYPKKYIFIYNATITVTTKANGTDMAANGRPFHELNYNKAQSLVWFLIKAPNMSPTEQSIINTFSGLSDKVSSFSTKPYLQEIKKFGVFGMLFGGAQITSCSVLVNNIPSQNMYEGVRFWANWVFFDVPNWQADSNKSRYVVSQPQNDIIKNARRLFNTSTVDWRFQRTGHTSFFVYDTYSQIFLIVLCWVLMGLSCCIEKYCEKNMKKFMAKIYSFTHKVHEISIMYIGLNTLLEWIYFESSSLQRWISLGFCMLLNVYFLGYELYIYYDMIGYPRAVIGNEKYEYYCMRYGSLLKNVRFEQYDVLIDVSQMTQKWSPKHWFRPYNYHILSYYKKLMMMVALPLFYGTPHAQISVLIILQLMEMVRFCLTWPFTKKWRNVYRLVLQFALLFFFCCVMAQGFLIKMIMATDDQQQLASLITVYYRMGWIGFGLVFFFNISFVVLLIYDIVRGCRMSNKQLMDEARRLFYFNKLRHYQQENEDVPLGLVNKWVKLGNLNKRNYDQLPQINLRVEYYRIYKNHQQVYQIEVKKLLEIYMNAQFNYSNENNVTQARKLNQRITLTRALSSKFYQLIDSIYQKYKTPNIEYITIKTFMKIDQKKFKPSERIQLKPQLMTQKLQLEEYSGQKKIQKLKGLLSGFPIPERDLQAIN